jgi:hypothetical protein
VLLDGLFAGDDGVAITFHEATHFSGYDVHRLQRTLQRRVLRLFERLRFERHSDARATNGPPGEAAIRQVRYDPARPTSDGRTLLVLSPVDLA